MNSIISIILALSFLIIVPKTYGDEPGPVAYTIKETSSLETVVTKLLPRFPIRYGKRVDEFKGDLIKWNPHVTNWHDIPLFTKIYIEYPYPVYISHSYAPPLGEDKEYIEINADAETPNGNNRLTVFTMLTP